MGHDAIPPRSRAVLADFIDDAASRGERIVCFARIGLALLSWVRSVSIWRELGTPLDSLAVLGGSGAVLFVVAFSAWMLWFLRTRSAPGWLLATSVTIDSITCFAALLTNPLWPGPGYAGLIYKPDLASLLLVVAATGLRLSPWVSAWGGGVNVVSLVVLLGIDARLEGPPLGEIWTDLSAFLTLIVGVATAAILIAHRTRRLVLEGAERAVRAERAERNLGELMHDQHDVRTLLSSASLNADLVLRALDRNDDHDEAAELAGQVREDLHRVNSFVASIRDRSIEDLTALQEATPSRVVAVFRDVAEQLAHRFPTTRFEVEGSSRALVSVSGGERALTRAARNLLVNAGEGNGSEASAVARVVVADAEDGFVRIEVSDDGPGFEDSLLGALERGGTTKPDGSGLGLAFVAELVRASGGRWTCENPPGGGALVTLLLPRVEA